MSEEEEFLAHLSEDGIRKQTVETHLRQTAELAGTFAAAFGCYEWGYGCGLLHDIGKYSNSFQKRIRGGSITDHATAGAQELWKNKNIVAAYCVAGHHSGLLDGGTISDGGGEATLQGRLKKKLDSYERYKETIQMPFFPAPPLHQLGKGGFSLSYFIRMLFSCLVDADYLDTEDFMIEGFLNRQNYVSMEEMQNRLMVQISPWLAYTDQTVVNGRRTQILKACLERGQDKQGLFHLTVPTGGGKTVSSLAFGLQHAVKHNLKRILYIIPYNSIIEQNAEVFRNILGRENVLEDHCNVVLESQEELKQHQLAAENWDKPIVVTTNVQFFESCFSSKSSKCRKLHNIANSVIIFDEAQMLPVPYLKPCIQVISELIHNYHCTIVLCTATQPSLQSFFPAQIKIKEICPEVEEQYEFFKRTLLKKGGQLSEEALTDLLRAEQVVLCILNSRKRVQRIYKNLEGEGIYHLSTLMYPAHRKRLLTLIRKRLHSNQVCKLIATSLVEAGVDFDFHAVYRELAGLDSVIQAAGRCNREGKRLKEESTTTVFTLEEESDIHIPNELKLPISVAKQIMEKYDDLSSLEAVAEYFRRLYDLKGDGLDKKDIVNQFENASRSFLFPFQTVSRKFRLIENQTTKIFVDLEPEAIKIAEKIRRGEASRQLVREAGQYCVNLYEKDFEALYGAGMLEQAPMDFYILRNKELYQEEMGLVVEVSRGEAVFY